MYKFQLISDLHLEFGIFRKITKCAEYLILAGDIGYPEQDIFKQFLTDQSKMFNKVFYVSGNHEYYQNWKRNIQIKSIDETNAIIKDDIKKCGNNIFFLNNDFYDLDDDVRIVGSTLWTNILPNSKSINDSFEIYSDQDTLVNDDYLNKLYKNNVEYLENQIKITKNLNKKMVIITHHLPSYQLILEKYNTPFYSKYNSHFASNLEYLMNDHNDTIKVWCAGHSHGFNHKIINNVPCYVNAFGYPKEDRNGSSLDFTFEINI